MTTQRRWFQIHLSTAVVMMFVAGGFFSLNFYGWRKPFISTPDTEWAFDDYVRHASARYEYHGFPFCFRTKLSGKSNEGRVLNGEEWYLSGIAPNVMIAVLVVFIAASALEAKHHKREWDDDI
ncbi:MAG TPA: hypothetical protein VEK08_04740 [Planctomycetota bacterium]|nr:hypothetical protein [Planctomycetota bacterium]